MEDALAFLVFLLDGAQRMKWATGAPVAFKSLLELSENMGTEPVFPETLDGLVPPAVGSIPRSLLRLARWGSAACCSLQTRSHSAEAT
jgi:hypothetical protein